MAWPFFTKKKTVSAQVIKSEAEAAAAAPLTTVGQANAMYEGFATAAAMQGIIQGMESKNFDWLHYQAVNQSGMGGLFQGEFGLIPTMRILKGMLLQEPWVNACINAISRQFLNSRLLLQLTTGNDSSKKQLISNHKLLVYLSQAGKEVESSSFFHANRITDLVTTGNAYFWNSQDLKDKRGIPSDTLEPVVRDNKIVEYRLISRNDLSFGGLKTQFTFQPEEITHIKMPNPFTPHVGLSMIIATVLPVLIDKYGREYIVGFFLRGGQTSGIIETETTNAEQMVRLAKTLMQAFGGRKNMHADKLLPKGATWKGQGGSFRDIRLVELLKENISHFRAATGCTNTVLGLVDNVNRATAQAEMELFWKATILPLQKLYCSAIKGSEIWQRFGLDDRYELIFDNSEVEYIDDFGFKLDQDGKLADTWTINERRERLGKKPLGSEYDKLAIELRPAPAAPLNFSFVQGEALETLALPEGEAVAVTPTDKIAEWKKLENEIQDPTRGVTSLFSKEFGAWEAIVLDNLTNKRAAWAKIQNRAEDFAKSLSEKTIDPAMRAYKHQSDHVLGASKAAGHFVKKESEQDRKAKLALLQERARQVIQDGIFDNGKRSFLGYSDTAMNSIYSFIEAEFEAGKSEADVASAVRTRFAESYSIGEAYEGQARTIVQQEFSSAISLAQAKFGSDLATVAETMSKYWDTLGDNHVRDSHTDCEAGSPITGPSSEVIDAAFPNGLRYPREPGAPADESINCRCTVRYEVITWKD